MKADLKLENKLEEMSVMSVNRIFIQTGQFGVGQIRRIGRVFVVHSPAVLCSNYWIIRKANVQLSGDLDELVYVGMVSQMYQCHGIAPRGFEG